MKIIRLKISSTVSLLIPLLAVFLAAAQCLAEEEPLQQQIRQWVQQLGDDSFLVRGRAESLLIRVGIQAYPALQRAKQHPDIEIVRRAEHILSQLEQVLLDMENREVVYWIQLYMIEPNPALKARFIWLLADATSDFSRGEGLQTLCRLVWFEENAALRIEAAKCLIASPPNSPALRQKWYRHIRDNTRETGDDELLQSVAHYAALWCDIDDAVRETTQKAMPEFHERIRQVGAETLRLLKRPENSIQAGSKVDILLHYAVAELQDAAGLTEERDETVAAALAVVSEPIQTLEPILQVGLDDDMPMNEHFYVGRNLRARFRLRWAIAHYQKVIESGPVEFRLRASEEVAETFGGYLADYPSAISQYDKYIEILNSDYAGSDMRAKMNKAQRRKTYFQAEQAAAEGNWSSVQDLLEQIWTMPETDNLHLFWSEDGGCDMLILAHLLCKQQSDTSSEFIDKMTLCTKKTWISMEADYNQTPADVRHAAMVGICNAAAWILAKTEGDYQTALTFAETALKGAADDASVLDTLAHVYFLGGKRDEAVRTQEQAVRLAPEAVVFRQALERFKQAKE